MIRVSRRYRFCAWRRSRPSRVVPDSEAPRPRRTVRAMIGETAAIAPPRPRALSAPAQRAREALVVWALFFVVFALIDGTIPFLLGADLRWWSTSVPKRVLIGVLVYGAMFLVVPALLSVKRREWGPDLVLLLVLAIVGLALQSAVRPAGVVAIVAIVCLHARYDLRGLGMRSRGWRLDLAAIALLAVLAFHLDSLGRDTDVPAIGGAFTAALDRLLFNPASTVENLFYFGFLTERLSRWIGVWVTPLVVGLLYLAHELSNPEYWYASFDFGLAFVGAVTLAALYLLRRNVVVVWLADGACRFASRVF